MKLTREQVVRFKEQSDELEKAVDRVHNTPAVLVDSDDVERAVDAHERFAATFDECMERLRQWGDSGQAMTPTGTDEEPPR